MGNGFYGCSYEGYCDFQRPLDSQTITYSSPSLICGEVKSDSDLLFAELGDRLIKRILENVDMSEPDSSDIELSLMRIIAERESLREQIKNLKEELKVCRLGGNGVWEKEGQASLIILLSLQI